MERTSLRKCKSAISLFSRRRNSVPALMQTPTRSMTRRLPKDNSCGSLMSIYDDQLSLSSQEDESSDSSLEPIPASPLEPIPGTPLADKCMASAYSSKQLCILEEAEDFSHPWFVGKLSRLEAEQLLEGMRSGTFLIRESEAPCSGYLHAIAVMNGDQPSHIRIFRIGDRLSVTCGESSTFSSLEELVEYFQRNTLASSFPGIPTTLDFPYHEEKRREQCTSDVSSSDYAEDLPVYDDPHEPPELPPRPSFIDTDLHLLQQPWFHGNLSRRGAESILSSKPSFSFLVRISESIPNGFSLSVRDVSGGFIHLKIECHTAGYVLGQNSRPFRTVPECIDYYCQERLKVKGATQRPLHCPVFCQSS